MMNATVPKAVAKSLKKIRLERDSNSYLCEVLMQCNKITGSWSGDLAYNSSVGSYIEHCTSVAKVMLCYVMCSIPNKPEFFKLYFRNLQIKLKSFTVCIEV